MDSSPEINPYAAPAVGTEPTHLPRLALRAQITRALLLLNIPSLLIGVAITARYGSRALTSQPGEIPTALIAPFTLVRYGMVALTTVTMVMFCVWIHTAFRRARSGVRGSRFTPGWSVGCWFIPIVNCFLPFLALRELWQMSRGGPEWQREVPPRYLVAWWVSWTLPIAAVTVLMIAAISKHPLAQGDGFGQVTNALQLVAAWLAARIVRDITAVQRERFGVD